MPVRSVLRGAELISMFLLSVPLCPSVLLSPLPNPSSHALAEASQELAAILLSAS